MVNQPIAIIILAYTASFCFLGVQSTLGDPMGVDMQRYNPDTGKMDGGSMREAIQSISDTFAGCYDSNSDLIGGYANQTNVDSTACFYADAVHQPTQWIQGTNSTFSQLSYQTSEMQLTMANEISITDNPLTSGATMIYQFFQIITGTYAFNLLLHLAIPPMFVAGISMIYIILISLWVIHTLQRISSD